MTVGNGRMPSSPELVRSLAENTRDDLRRTQVRVERIERIVEQTAAVVAQADSNVIELQSAMAVTQARQREEHVRAGEHRSVQDAALADLRTELVRVHGAASMARWVIISVGIPVGLAAAKVLVG